VHWRGFFINFVNWQVEIFAKSSVFSACDSFLGSFPTKISALFVIFFCTLSDGLSMGANTLLDDIPTYSVLDFP